MRESQIEAYLVKRCKELGILCEKFVSPGSRSVPDRILGYAGRVVFLELKATGEKPSDAQLRDHERRGLQRLFVRWTDSKEGVDELLRAIKAQDYPRICAKGPGNKVWVPNGD